MTRTTLIAKTLATLAVALFILLVVAGGIAAAFLYPLWAVAAYGVGSAYAGYMAGEALGEVWTCDLTGAE